jgi:hypothetical protein
MRKSNSAMGRRFNSLQLELVAFIGAVIPFSLQPAHADDAKWDFLVNEGRLLADWETKGNWSVGEDDVVRLEPRSGEIGWRRFDAYLWSTRKYKDFEIRFDYNVQSKGNSGFYFHVGDKADPVQRGIEVQLFDSHARKPGDPLNDHDSGGVIPGIPPTRNAAKPAGEWNRCRIVVQDGTLKVILNRQLVNEVSLMHPHIKKRPLTGYIGFQDHGLPLALRDVRVMDLGESKRTSLDR